MTLNESSPPTKFKSMTSLGAQKMKEKTNMEIQSFATSK